MPFSLAAAVETSRALQRLFVQRGIVMAPPETWRAHEGVYVLFEQTIIYAGLTPGLSTLLEDLRTAVHDDAERGLSASRRPAVLSAIEAVRAYGALRGGSGGIYTGDELACPPNRYPTLLPAKSTVSWAQAMQLDQMRRLLVQDATIAQYQSAFAPRDIDRNEAILRWLYVYATGACDVARRVGVNLGGEDGEHFRYPASMFVWNPKDLTQVCWMYDNDREASDTGESRRYVMVAQTNLGIGGAAEPPLGRAVRYQSAPNRMVAPFAQTLQVLGQNRQNDDLLVREANQMLRIRTKTGEVATVQTAGDASGTAAGGHPGENQQSVGGVRLTPTGQFAHAITRTVVGFMEDAPAATPMPYFSSPGQALAVLDDDTDASEIKRGFGSPIIGTGILADSATYDSGRNITCANLPEGGGYRYLSISNQAAADIVVGPQDLSRIEHTYNEASPFEDLLNVLLNGQV